MVPQRRPEELSSNDPQVPVAENLARVREQIATACEAAGRGPDEVTLVCVSKTKPAELIRQAMAAGAVDFGENYVQEAEEKVRAVEGPLRWHMIGHLQSNKAAKAAELFQMVQSVDSEKLARRLSNAAEQAGKTLEILIEVNVAGEESKTGVPADEALDLAAAVAGLPSLNLRGIMGIPPFLEPEAVRPYFVRLREIWEQLPAQHRQVLSMGMSGDFEVAIQEGSTMVRVGTAIFGSR